MLKKANKKTPKHELRPTPLVGLMSVINVEDSSMITMSIQLKSMPLCYLVVDFCANKNGSITCMTINRKLTATQEKELMELFPYFDLETFA